MKKIIIVACCLFATLVIQAQTQKINSLPKNKFNDGSFANRLKNKLYSDSLKYSLTLPKSYYRSLPIAGSLPKRLNYIGNNQQGFDIYQTPHDNMYIVKPDTSFASNMPVTVGVSSSYKPADMPNPKKDKSED